MQNKITIISLILVIFGIFSVFEVITAYDFEKKDFKSVSKVNNEILTVNAATLYTKTVVTPQKNSNNQISSNNIVIYNYDYQISDKRIAADGKCSCSLSTDYKLHHGEWVNYCPYCHKFGTLSYYVGPDVPEGMIYCDRAKNGCDADFCVVHGKAHTNKNPKFLIPFGENNPILEGNISSIE
jgi:hypothetical protein